MFNNYKLFTTYFVFIIAASVILLCGNTRLYASDDPKVSNPIIHDIDFLTAQNTVDLNNVTFTDQSKIPLVHEVHFTNGTFVTNQSRPVNGTNFVLADTFTLAGNPGASNNGGSAGWAEFFDLIAGPRNLIVTQMSTGSTAGVGATYTVDIYTRVGTSLGGPVAIGPGSSTAGWTMIGTANVTQGAVANGTSLVFPIPPITMNAHDTVGVAVKFNVVGPRYFGTGSPPIETYADTNLTLRTGEGRSAPFTPTGSWFSSRALTGVIRYVVAAPPQLGPDYLYYKFENNPTSLSTPNCAFPGAGTTVAAITSATLSSGGQFDSCLTGTGLTSTGVNTGWNTNLGTSSWTISFWMSIPTTTSIGYLFGDPGANSFRAFYNGAAGTNNMIVRFSAGGGAGDMIINGVVTTPCVVTIVYDSAAGNVKGYKDGVLSNTVAYVANIITGTGFRVGGYSTSAGINGKMDEFRLYRRALSAAEILATYNADLPCGLITGISGNNNEVPASYKLFQNYPNPFNPSTNITFTLPKEGFVELTVYDILGRTVGILVQSPYVAGTYKVDFDASKLASGIYFYTIKVNDFSETKKMLLIK